MKKMILVLLMTTGFWVKAQAFSEDKNKPGRMVDLQTFEEIQHLAGEKTVVGDILAQNHQPLSPAEALALQEKWVQSTDRADWVKSFQQKPSSQTMKQYFARSLSLVDCYTLDAQGRVVGLLYKPTDFIQDENPAFVLCYHEGEGRLYVDHPMPLGPQEAVEIALPVKEGGQTVGVLVATVLLVN